MDLYKRIKTKIRDLSFRTRIIITFSLITVLLVITLSRISYVTVRDIYLNQLADQMALLTRQIAESLNVNQLGFMQIAEENNTTNSLYRNILKKEAAGMQLMQAFLFNKKFSVAVQTDTTGIQQNPRPALILYRSEINNLQTGECMTTRPFKGKTGFWYLWGFYRLTDEYYLGVQENAQRLAKVDQLAMLFLGIGVLGVLVTVIACWFLARTLSKPVERLVRFSDELGKGHFDTPLPANIYGEFTALSSALHRMRTDLKRHHHEKEQMLAQIAHEIRNPLGGIELLGGLVKEDLQKDNKDSEYINKILSEISGLKTLITAYLNYSRPMQPESEWLNIAQIVEEVVQLLDKKIQQKNIQFNYAGECHAVRFDPAHLRQILMNILSNSLEVAPRNSQIELTCEQRKDSIVIEISDQGPGIPEEHRSRIFEPFFSTHTNGTGLGLAICKKLCQANQAEIAVENNEQKGCTFRIILDGKQYAG